MASKFNAEAYRREAKALGLTDEQIESDIAEEMGGDQGQFSEPTAESVDLNKDKTIPGWLQPAAAVTGIGVAAGAGKSIYDRYMRSRELDPFKIEPKMDVNQKPADGRIEPVWDPKQVVNQVNAEQVPVQAEAQQMGQKATEKAVTTGGVPPKGGGKISPTDMGMVASSEQAKIEKAITAQQTSQKAAAAVPPAAPAAPTAGKAQKAPKGTAVPEGMVFKEGYGPGDNWLFNTYGAEGRRAILSQFNEGKPIGDYNAALELQKKIEQARPGPEIPRSVAKERGIPPPETNYGKLGKPAKIAGAGGLLLTAAMEANAAEEAAQAAKRGDTQMTRGYLTDILGAFTGPFGLIASQVFGTSPEDLKILRQAEQARKAGAGRGTTSASSYKR